MLQEALNIYRVFDVISVFLSTAAPPPTRMKKFGACSEDNGK